MLEVAALRAEGRRVKPVFVMRDGHLPKRVCDALAGEEVGPAVSLSRFAAYAASFRTAADIDRYLGALRAALMKTLNDGKRISL